MKKILSHGFTASRLFRLVTAMILISLLAPSIARTQGTEPPYNPCPPELSPTPSCLNGSRSCDEPQAICSEGYCWSGGVPSKNAGIPPGGLVENKVIEIAGTYTLTISATFKNCTFRMSGDARIKITPIGNDTIKVIFDNCDLYSCTDMWQGIILDASGATLNGLITEGGRCIVISDNNIYERISDHGIWSFQATSIGVLNSTFGLGSGVCIFTDGTSLSAQNNVFGGNWVGGIHAVNNLHAQGIGIGNQNQFNILGSLWEFGILVERSQASQNVKHCVIDHNTFTVGANVEGFTCIELLDLVNATDVAAITWNTINVNSMFNPVFGISAVLGNSDKLLIEENTITYGTSPISGFGSFGIVIKPVNPANQNASQGHVVRHNTITGPNIKIDALTCAIHSESVQGIEYCDNIVDFSYRGLHYKNDCGDVALRQNHMHNHTIGLDISGQTWNDMPGIGKQSGRGNTWNILPNDCLDKAIRHDVPLDSMNMPILITSLFRVPEFNAAPFRYMPNFFKISPDPTILGPNLSWFIQFPDSTDYCLPGLAPESPRQLMAYEKQLVDGLSPYTSTTLWDLKLRTNTKLLLHPELRPTGSPEAMYLNSLANTSISSFGQVIQTMVSSLAISAADQQLFDSYNTSIKQAAENLSTWDATIDTSYTNNLTESWFAARLLLLQPLVANASNLSALVTTRNAQVATNLQNVLAYNSGISTSQAYETANKVLYDIWLHRLLQVPLTQAYYQQILALAQQNPASAGIAARSAANFVAPCDQYLFQYDDGESAQRSPAQARDGQARGLAAFQISPNPSSGLVEVSLSPSMATSFVVINTFGQKVHNIDFAAGTRTFSLDLSRLSSGLYWGILLDAQGHRIGIETLSLNH
jgi:hypothetical protein